MYAAIFVMFQPPFAYRQLAYDVNTICYVHACCIDIMFTVIPVQLFCRYNILNESVSIN